MSKHNLTQIAGDLGSSISYLSPENVSAIPWTHLKEIQQNVSVWWTPAQMHALMKKRLQGMKVRTKPPQHTPRAYHWHLSVQTDDEWGVIGPRVTCKGFAELCSEEGDSHEDAHGQKGAEEHHQAYEEGPDDGRVAKGEWRMQIMQG